MRALLLIGVTACSLNVSYTGTNYQCSPDGTCPPNFICESKVCVPVAPAPPACSTQVAAGDSHACAVRNDGTVWCWGNNSNGQLGDGTATDRDAPVQVTMLKNAVAVGAGAASSCALLKSGDVWCWGHNDVGELGDGTNSDSRTPVQVKNVAGATALAVGAEHACALLGDGSLPCWGSNDHGELGDGTHSSRSMAMPVTVPTATAIAAGDDFTCAIDTSGTARCWGANDSGQIGNGMTSSTDVTMPSVVMMLMPVVGVAAGSGFACANDAAGAVWCWGSNSNGQLGNGTQGGTSTMPQQVDNAVGLHALVAGSNHACGIDDYKHMWCWGYDGDGRLADGNPTQYRPVPTMSEIQDVVAIAAGGEHGCAVDSKGAIRCAGFDRRGDLGDGLRTTQGAPQAVPGISGAVASAAGASHTCVALMDGSARCGGANGNGQLGDGTTIDNPNPTTVIGIGGVTALAAGGDHTCAIGDGLVFCWGDNSSQQVGAGDFDSPVPQFVSQLGGFKTDELAAGSTASCALRSGQALCWGNQYGQMAITAQGYTDVTHVVLGGGHTCVLRSSGEVDCWGSNSYGQLGNGSCCVPTSAPQTVGGLSNVVGLSLRGSGSCALLGDGSAKCWGFNGDDNLGLNNYTTVIVDATAVMNLSGAMELAKGDDASCARRNDGTVWCWGPGGLGEVGDSQYNTRGMATEVPGLSNVMQVVAGGSHACALLGDGTVSCWGLDTQGQLGDGVHASQHPVGVQMTCPQ